MSNIRIFLYPFWAVLFFTMISVAQDGARPSFDVASIKPNTSSDNRVGIGFQPGGRFTGTNVTLKTLMSQAYRVQDFQILGGPGWINSDRYDIDARAPEVGAITPNQLAPMIATLLEERFKLKIHRETRELPVYDLVVSSGGSKLKPSLDENGQPRVAVPPPGARGGLPPGPPGPPVPGAPLPPGAIRITPGGVMATAVPVSQLANLLSQQLGRPVIDKTGITGLYDIQIQFTPEGIQGIGPFGPPPAGPAPPAPGEFTGPSIFTAIQEQLGLKLESTKGQVEVIVIDSVEKPSEN